MYFAFLHGAKLTRAMQKRIEDSGTLHFCMGLNKQGPCESHRGYTHRAFLHEDIQSRATLKYGYRYYAFLHGFKIQWPLKLQPTLINALWKNDKRYGEQGP